MKSIWTSKEIFREAKTIHEKEILKDIQDLPESMQEKFAKVVHFLKKEIILPEFNEKMQ